MGRFQILIYLCLCFFLCGCYNYKIHRNGAFQPKNPKYKFQENPYKLKPEDLIKTDRVYCLTDTLSYGSEEFKVVFFYRFYQDGRFFRGSFDAKKVVDTKKINTPTFVGYYKMKDESEIQMEYFFVKWKEKGWYIKNQGYIKNDTLFIKGNDENGNYKESIYVPKKIEGLNSTPNW